MVVPFPDAKYVLDAERSTFGFRAQAFGLFWVTGTLLVREGTASITDGVIQAEGVADAGSVSTGLGVRDRHLRHRHYLDSAAHPDIRLVFSAVPIAAKEVDAQLSVRGKWVHVRFDVEAFDIEPEGALTARLTGAFDRRPLGMLPPRTGVSRRIQLTFDVVANPS